MINVNSKALFPLAIISTLLMSSDDFLQQWFSRATNQAQLEWNFVLVMVIFNACLWTVSSRWLSNSILTLFALFSFVQIGNISYFGQPLNPADLPNFFNDLGEVWQTGTAGFEDTWQVPAFTIIPYAALFFLHNRYRCSAATGWRMVCLLLIIAILASKPYRATYRSMAFFMPGPTRSSLHNSLNAWSYYVTHIRSMDQVIDAGRIPLEHITYRETPTTHVWLVVADSLRADRLSAYGYQRDTTPNLKRRVEAGQVLAKHGIAAGVSTIVSLSHMVNQIHQPARQKLLSSHHTNIYRHAKAQGYQTLWLSSQESKLLSFLNANDIDISITNEDKPLLFAQKGDLGLLDVIAEQPWQAPSFAIINLRTVHSPYASNYEGLLATPPWPTDPSLDRTHRENNAYDNALVFLDQAVESIINAFESLPGEGYLVVTGDHGQFLGQDNRWGHNKLEPDVIEVPVMIMAKHAQANALTQIKEDPWISHIEMMHWLSQKMGIDIQGQPQHPTVHYVKGSKLLGDNHIRTVTEHHDTLEYGPIMLISEWLAAPQE